MCGCGSFGLRLRRCGCRFCQLADVFDESGLVDIIRQYRDGLIFYLYSIVADLVIAEELAEDVFVLLGTKKPKDNGKGSFKTWLYTIGRNKALNYIKKQKRHPEISVEDCPEMADDSFLLETMHILEDRKLHLHRAMQTLKPEYRQILWLVYFEELSLKDAAAIFKKSVHSTETLVYRARKSLKQQLEKEGFTYEEY